MIASSRYLQLGFTQKSEKVSLQFFRNLLVGGFAFAVDFSAMAFLAEYMKIYYLVSSVFGFVSGLSINYILCIKWSFYNRSIKNRYIEFFLFFSISMVGLLTNSLLVWFFTEIFYFHYLISKIFAAMIVFLWNFSAKKIALFR